MVGWVRFKAATRSHTQTGAAWRRSVAIMLRRVGSASALSSSTVSPTLTGSTATSRSQQTPRVRTGSSFKAMGANLPQPIDIHRWIAGSVSIDVGQWLCEVAPMSEIREAVRVHYAEAARQAAGSCCDTDCGCGFMPEGALELALATP